MRHTPNPTGPLAPAVAARAVLDRARAASRDGDPIAEVRALGAALRDLLGPPSAPGALPPPAALAVAVRNATAPTPGYRDPAELARALEAWLAAELGRPRPVRRSPPPFWARASVGAVAILGLVPLAAGVAALAAQWPAAGAPRELRIPEAARSAPVFLAHGEAE